MEEGNMEEASMTFGDLRMGDAFKIVDYRNLYRKGAVFMKCAVGGRVGFDYLAVCVMPDKAGRAAAGETFAPMPDEKVELAGVETLTGSGVKETGPGDRESLSRLEALEHDLLEIKGVIRHESKNVQYANRVRRFEYHTACYYSAVITGLLSHGDWREPKHEELLAVAVEFAVKAVKAVDEAVGGKEKAG